MSVYCLTADFDILLLDVDIGTNARSCIVFGTEEGGFFNLTLNSTDCHDGTFCPNANNETCCINKQGVPILTFRNTALIPSPVTQLTSYYSAAGYSIPTATTSASAPSNSTTLPPGSDNSESSSGLSSGAKVGIGVGVAVGVLAVAAAALLLIRRYRRRRQESQSHDLKNTGSEGMPEPGLTTAGMQDMVGKEPGIQGYKQEIDGQEMGLLHNVQHEMTGASARMEMDTASPERRTMHELGVDRPML